MKNSLSRILLFILLIPVALGCKEEITYLKDTEQQQQEENSTDSELVSNPDVTAGFPGGAVELNNFIHRNLHYPAAAQRANISGNVTLSLEVTEQGKLEKITVLQGIGFGCDEEAARIVKAMPDWEPGKKSGKKVRTKVRLPIEFVLQ